MAYGRDAYGVAPYGALAGDARIADSSRRLPFGVSGAATFKVTADATKGLPFASGSGIIKDPIDAESTVPAFSYEFPESDFALLDSATWDVVDSDVDVYVQNHRGVLEQTVVTGLAHVLSDAFYNLKHGAIEFDALAKASTGDLADVVSVRFIVGVQSASGYSIVAMRQASGWGFYLLDASDNVSLDDPGLIAEDSARIRITFEDTVARLWVTNGGTGEWDQVSTLSLSDGIGSFDPTAAKVFLGLIPTAVDPAFARLEVDTIITTRDDGKPLPFGSTGDASVTGGASGITADSTKGLPFGSTATANDPIAADASSRLPFGSSADVDDPIAADDSGSLGFGSIGAASVLIQAESSINLRFGSTGAASLLVTVDASKALPLSSTGTASFPVTVDQSKSLPLSSVGVAAFPVTGASNAPLPFGATGAVALTVTADSTKPLPFQSTGDGTVADPDLSERFADSTARLPLGSIGQASVPSTDEPPFIPLPFRKRQRQVRETADIHASSTQRLPFGGHGAATIAIRGRSVGRLTVRSIAGARNDANSGAIGSLPLRAHGAAVLGIVADSVGLLSLETQAIASLSLRRRRRKRRHQPSEEDDLESIMLLLQAEL